MQKVCQSCQKQPATVHLTDIATDGEKRERHLCENCAQNEGIMPKPANIMAHLAAFVQSSKGTVQQMAQLSCPNCQLTFVEFRNNGLLGCAADYDAFEPALIPLIERAHQGASRHVGKTPKRAGGDVATENDIVRLRRELDRAVDDERFEEAARIRDTIRSLELS